MRDQSNDTGGRGARRRLWRRIETIDRAALVGLYGHRRRWLVAVLGAVTWSGATVGWAVLGFGLLVWGTLYVPGRQAAADLLAAAAASGLTAIAGRALKPLVRRPRPWIALPEIRPVAQPRERWSFPSSHAATSSAFATALFVVGHPLAPVVALWAGFVAFSRLYLSLHYPSDVLGGVLLGFTIGLPFGLLAWPPFATWLGERVLTLF